MKTLRECLREATEKKVAIGHFNISDTEGLWAVFRAAYELKLPVIIGVSEGERDFIGVRQAAALAKSLREEFDYPIFLNADHTYSFERVKEAVDAGFDAVIFDGAKLPLEENIQIAKQCVDYARSKNPEILIEGELGYIGTSSKILDSVPEGVNLGANDLTKPEVAKQFVEATDVDLLAPAVGNIHGMLRDRPDPSLNIDRIIAIKSVACPPCGGLVLHGGSGNSEQDFKAAIAAGVSIVHINTELRVAYRNALKLSLQATPDEVAPYKFIKPAVSAMQKVVEKKLKLFNNLS
ncbi:MAG: class II fructose-bisphosphate aldolase [Candidatus Vogelbacteria bacterium]|nr:class II fructose-bisphosphate aldolase [Candidatus Vogelbacteria bacterium]